MQSLRPFRNSLSSELWSGLQNFPVKGDSLVKRLSPGGEYHIMVQNNVGTFDREIKKEIEKLVVNSLNLENLKSLLEVEFFIDCLQDEISKTLNRCPIQPPALITTHLNRINLISAEEDVWAKLLGLRDDAVNQKKEQFAENFERLLLNHLEKLKAHFMRSSLEKLATLLQEKKQQVVSIKEKLEKIQRNSEELYAKLIDVPEWTNVQIVFQRGSIQNDIAHLQGLMKIEDPGLLIDIVGDIQLSKFFMLKESHMMERIKNALQKKALRELRTVNATAMALEMQDDSMRQLIERSIPYQAFAPEYKRASFGNVPNLIMGGGAGELSTLGKKLTQLGFSLPTGGRGVVISPIADHLVILYQEQGAFTIDDLAFAAKGTQIYQAKPGQYGHHTHKDPNFYSIERVIEEREEAKMKQSLQMWLDAARELFPEAFQKTGPPGKERLAFIYTSQESGLKTTVYLDDQNAISRIVKVHDEFISRLKEYFREIGKQTIVEKADIYHDKLVKEGMSQEEIDRKIEAIEMILRETFQPDKSETNNK